MIRRRVRAISQLASRASLAILLVVALLLKIVDTGEQISTSEKIGRDPTYSVASPSSDPRVDSGHLLTKSPEGTVWSTPESEGGYWATLTSSSHDGLSMLMPASIDIDIPVRLCVIFQLSASYVSYFPHGPPGELSSRAPPISHQLSRPLDA